MINILFNYLKTITVIIILFPSISYAEYNWKKIVTSEDGDVYYVDLSSIKRVENNILFLRLKDYVKPDKYGDLSNKIYGEVNCLNYDFKYHKDFYYLEPMGNGDPSDIYNEESEWYKYTPGSVGEIIYQFVCNNY